MELAEIHGLVTKEKGFLRRSTTAASFLLPFLFFTVFLFSQEVSALVYP